MSKDEHSNNILQTRGESAVLILFLVDVHVYAQTVEHFETTNDGSSSTTAHHEEGHSLHVTFQTNVSSFMEIVEQPFVAA